MSSALTSTPNLDFTPRAQVFPSPRDWRDQFIYQLLIDRFDDNQDHPPFDPAAAPRGHDPAAGSTFQGGKIKGVTRRLDYLRNLGCTTLWISPPFKNRQEDPHTSHGYGIQNFLEIDPRFGALQDLQELVQAAHAKGMYVILDIIINHTGNNWGYPDDQPLPYNDFDRYPFGAWRGRDGRLISANGDGSANPRLLGPDDAVWPAELQNPDFYNRRGRIRDFSGCAIEEALNGDFCDLKDFDLRRPEVLDTLIRCYKYWIAVTDIDGYRLDTVKHSDPEATALFCNAIREYARSIGKDNFILFGEVVADDELLGKYIGSNCPADAAERYPRLNACLDFPLYFVLEEVIKGQTSPQALRQRYEKFRHFYRDFGEVGRYFVTFVDNHDQMARPYRRFMHGADDPNLAVLAIGYLLTNMGIPCIYYGTEQGFNGAGKDDLAVRENMFGGSWGAFDTRDVHFFNPDHPIYKAIAAIAQIRADEPALRYGREYFRDISGNGVDFGPPTTGQCTLAYSRVLDTTEILIALNLDTSPRADCVTVDPHLTPPGSTVTDLLNGGAHTVESGPHDLAFLRLPLQPRCMAILKKAES